MVFLTLMVVSYCLKPLRAVAILFMLININLVSAQVSNVNLQTSYLLETPAGDLSQRFGYNNKFEFRVEFLSASKWALYLKSGLRLGDKVEEDVLAPIRTKDGFVIGVNGFYADVFGRKRGFDYLIGIDKLLPLNVLGGENDLRFGVAGGRAQHWIRIADDSRTVPQILDDYAALYDHYSRGWAIEENIQFQYNTKSNNAAFLIGFQFQQLFANETRSNLIGSKSTRIDLYSGIKLTYLLPLYTFSGEKTVYY